MSSAGSLHHFIMLCSLDQDNTHTPRGGGGYSYIVELLMLVNQPPKWTLNGVISVGVFATLNGVTLRISNPKWRT